MYFEIVQVFLMSLGREIPIIIGTFG